MLEFGTPAVLKIETIGSLGSAGVPESQNHELYYGRNFQENQIILTIKYDLTISTDKAIVLIRPPGLVTLFLSLVGNVICNTFKNDRKSSNKRKPGLALFEHQSAAISTN